MHVSKFPQRSWAIILQQAWSMCLKDRIKLDESKQPNGSKQEKVNEPCKHYNKGKCKYGANCKFEHRCAIKRCRKFGHGAHIYRLHGKDGGSETSKDVSK